MPDARVIPPRDELIALDATLIGRVKLHADISPEGFLHNECWPWRNGRQRYPQIGVRLVPGGPLEIIYASRVSFIIQHGELDPLLEVDHRCMVPRCVNPTHLLGRMRAQNLSAARMYAKIAKFAAEIVGIAGFRPPVVIGHQRLHEAWELPEYNRIFDEIQQARQLPCVA